MRDGKLTIDTSIDTKGIVDGVKKVDSTLKTIAKGGAVFAGITAAVKGATSAIKDTTAAYRTQATAEKQLEVAAKNNPYLDSNSVKQLKDYASQLQSISTTGDEALIPMMAQLASTGRTQTEIQQIMATALDVSASGMMSLDSAVTQLNATYSGNVGLMGRQVTELKNLTKEELASGKAVEIMGQKYKGMAEEVAKSTGSSQQLSNSIGDLKEQIGAQWENTLSPLRKGLQGYIDKWTEAIKKTNEAKESLKQLNNVITNGTGDSGAANSAVNTQSNIVENARQEVKDLEEYASLSAINWLKRTKDQKKRYAELNMTYGDYLEKLNDGTKSEIELIALGTQEKQTELQKQENILKELKDKAEQIAESEKKTAEDKNKQDAQNTRDKLRGEYDEKLKAISEEINKRRALGQTITEEEEAQQLLDAAVSNYIEMMNDPAFAGNNGNYEHERKAREDIAYWTSLIEQKEMLADADSVITQAESELEEVEETLGEQIKTQIGEIENYINEHQKEGETYEQLVNKKIELEKLLTQVTEKESAERLQKQKEDIAEMASVINSYFSQFADITSGITSLVRKQNEDEANAQLGDIAEQYNEGIITYEEYCDKKKEIDKKAAQEEYKLKMWEYTSSILTATANVAEGISKAIAQGGVLGMITGALVGAAGAVQLATIVANKPKAPSFATGGFLTGNSYSGDKIAFKGNAGEAILNPAEMRNFMDMANGDYKGNGTMINVPVNIINNTSANVSTQLDSNGLKVVIDDIVNSSMQRGTYNKSMEVAQSSKNGVSYL